jgi:Methylmalonyl-CoA mutase
MINWNAFSKMDTDAWMEKANQDSKGKYVAEDFVYNVENDFLISPFTDFQPSKSYESIFKTHSKSGIFISSLESTIANKNAIHYLETGVESVLFYVDVDTNYAELFKDIFLEYVSIILIAKDDLNICKKQLKTYLAQIENSDTLDITLVQDKNKGLKAEQSFKERLTLFAEWIKNIPTEPTFTLFIEPKSDFLAQIAELRALRILWHDHNFPQHDLKIIVTSTPNDNNSDVHPLIIENYKLMSAYLGMCDLVAIRMEEDLEMTRLLLNMTYIFKEESRLNAVLDPVAGSYIIENLTAQMVEKASSL